MKLGIVKMIQRDELSRFEALPAWVNPLLQVLNQFILNVGSALKGNLTFQDNFLCTVKQLDFKDATEKEINPESKFRVVGVLPLDSGGEGIDIFKWRQLQNGNIGVTFTFVTAAATKPCRILILLG